MKHGQPCGTPVVGRLHRWLCLLLALALSATALASCEQTSASEGGASLQAGSAASTVQIYIDEEKAPALRADSEKGIWEKRADATQAFMRENFFGAYDMYQNKYPLTRQRDNATFHYWIQAQVLDSIVDAYIRTGDAVYAQRAKELIAAVKKRNGNHITNDLYDDMGWMANAAFRLYQATGDQDLWSDIDLLYRTIADGWNEASGGIAWRRDQMYYRNSPSNGPACILAARLYQHTGEQEYLDMALRIFDWWTETLVDPETGLVWDGINRQMDGKIDKNWQFTYCQGVYIGACVELYRITNEQDYIDKAVRTADYALDTMLESGILRSEGGGDGGAFKGIFCRYLTQLILTTPVNRELYCRVLERNGEALWANIPSEEEPICSEKWSDKPGKSVELQVQSSGLALLESLAVLNKMGYIS